MKLDLFVRKLRGGAAGFVNGAGKKTIQGIVIPFAFTLAIFLLVAAGQFYGGFRFNHLSASEHLLAAKAACQDATSATLGSCSMPQEAISHLEKIPRSAIEYKEAASLMVALRHRVYQQEFDSSAKEREDMYLAKYSQPEARERMLKNTRGDAHDEFACDHSTNGEPIMSFDNRHYWWLDDGRCASRLESQRQQRQAQRDEESKILSYRSKTLRVDTDMDSGWLANEERICQTTPGLDGTVVSVMCDLEGTHKNHNIPVKFWGGTDRGISSSWKCIREKDLLTDEFVCRATN